ncbi:MAG TPA: sensor histidine kinase [Candidatus Dormibacteraeota bacterium]|nr:sensor histidine kinase [Candidatus Dormibacteraeota bacterium]
METRPRAWGWIGRLQPRTFDRLLVGVLLLLGLINTLLDLRFADRGLRLPSGAPAGTAILIFVGLALLLLQVVPLLWRRSHPSFVLLLVAGAFGARVLLGFNPGIAGFGLLVAMYSVAAYEVGVRRVFFLVVAGLGFVAGFVAFVITGNPRSFAITVPSVFFVAAWLIGDYLRTRRAYVAQLEERAARLERERDQDRQLAADEERSRIARELHDVVAHDVSVIAIQAGAARAVQATRPEAAAQALGLIETTARETLIELNRLLGVLRGSNGASPDRSPQPGIGQLAGLVEELRAAGLEVDARVDGEPRSLPPALDLSAYRIVQEATTNVLKHAGARRVDIRVHYTETMLALDVRDDGAGDGSDSASSSGHGLIGMRERVAVFGGELRAGRDPAGGFSVHARLPIDSTHSPLRGEGRGGG